ncbi:hypothetical protein [Rhodoplanes sp. Z2-YC6860]|uniref:hypothetical protein n=1 Tax=Rhodoplanes sp. Z2-YC6860 TaxID=674703 RepID=UPI000831CD60|nr:hypothetical protein [Rhodoplanes sp. Z2-YC6860]
MDWDYANTPLLAKVLEKAVASLPENDRTPKNAGVMRYAVRDGIIEGERDEQKLVDAALKSVS